MLPSSKMMKSAVLILGIVVAVAGEVVAIEVKYDAGGRRDPFVPLEGGDEAGAGARKVASLTLEGIVYDPPQNSVALIGGQPCKVGDAVGEGKVLEIHKENVVVELNSERTTLWLREDDRPQPSGGGTDVS